MPMFRLKEDQQMQRVKSERATCNYYLKNRLLYKLSKFFESELALIKLNVKKMGFLAEQRLQFGCIIWLHFSSKDEPELSPA